MLSPTLCLLSMLCAAEPTTPAPASTATPAVTSPAAPTPVAPIDVNAPPKFELLSQGDEPRTALRLNLQPGSTQAVVMGFNMQMKIAANGEEVPPQRMPEFETSMVIVVDEALPDGGWKYHALINSFIAKPGENVAPHMVTIMNGMLTEMVGMRIEASIDPRGMQRDIGVTSKITNPMLFQQIETMKQSMAQMSIVLPDKEVGIGAKWATEATLNTGAVRVRQRQTYRLVEKSADRIKCSLTLQQWAAEKNAPMTGLPGGATGTLVDLKSEGLGELQFRLNYLMPETAKATAESVANMDIVAEGVQTKMDTRTVVVVTVNPAPAATESASPKSETK